MITTPLAPSQSINESTTSHLSIKKNPTASISSDNSNLSNITPKKRVASSDKKLDKKQADKKRKYKILED
ncbi:8211_t:CDS:2 [Entrophospora sp. SA101]|nr:7340_t:CDS:2 [Entrophospora sp. SA101]CAJ0635665.1 8778_t:CDS:2 [Entrophospora sp. SA101]CAJ0755455.1 8211_t:CDS:2 [Entrophospora sp. SA101]CAJ0845502.1 9582_t:CDS:2 [Entrophospora sp. SA101]CAJ0858579.1 1329_t:CDS:2 [Entrophospora sp. SA101]